MNPENLTLTSLDFLAKFKAAEASGEDVDGLIIGYVERMESSSFVAPEFPANLEWLNCSSPLRLSHELGGKLRVMDFFTYCCINCMHVLPDLHALEERFSVEDGIAVVGVHSAKFGNEKVTANILSAILRYDITHPVVNDGDAVLWNEMSIKCWPTFAIVSPTGKVLLYLVGEGHGKALLRFCEVALQHYKTQGLISDRLLPIQLEKSKLSSTVLSFPGKISCSKDTGDLMISDTGHHRILVVDADGIVKQKIGGTERGYKDGSAEVALFNSPQGLAHVDGCIYVADTENHCIRMIKLADNMVSTVAGIGRQGNDKEGGHSGTEQEISSPWDLIAGPAPGSSSVDSPHTVLYIAMAGTHQIWAYYLAHGGFFKGGSHPFETCVRVAGSGNEENRNNSYPHKASFAQPSGVTIATVKDTKVVYIADSESSSVRSMEVKSGAVKGCVGAERDPMNLFAYGDVDGKSVDAKLQHPLAVAWNETDSLIYVADSYNHKIKIVDPTKNTCTSLAGTGHAGLFQGSFNEAQFNEPGGLAVSSDGGRLFVADTNNHAIRVLDLKTGVVSQLHIIDPDGIASTTPDDETDSASTSPRPRKRLVAKNAPLIQNDPVTLDAKQPIAVELSVKLPAECEYTNDVESRWQVDVVNVAYASSESCLEPSSGFIDKNTSCITTKARLPINESPLGLLEFQLLVYYCSSDGVCRMSGAVIQQPYVNSKRGSTQLTLEHVIHM